MTRTEMENVIHKGGTILHEGKMISRVEELPTTADLAGQDIPKLQAELAKCDKEEADLKAKRDKLKASLTDAHATAKQTPAKPEPAPVVAPVVKKPVVKEPDKAV